MADKGEIKLGVLVAELIKFLSVETSVILTAALPVVELRGSIPIGIALGLSPVHAALISLFGSMLPVPVLLFSVRPVLDYLQRTKLMRNRIRRLIDRSLGKSGNVRKYGFWGLLLFVAIPLPGTGVWTGTLIAALLDLRFKTAFPAILLGNIIDAILIMAFSHGVVQSVNYIQ